MIPVGLEVNQFTQIRFILEVKFGDNPLTIQKQPPEVSIKKVFLKISQNSQKNTCAKASFSIELQTSDLELY